MATDRHFFYAGIGARLTAFRLDADDATLERLDYVTLPAAVQYAWRHPHRSIVYVVSSNGGPAGDGGNDVHHASAWRLDPSSGTLSPLGEARALPARPLHCSVDHSGSYLLVAYNQPSGLTVHALDEDGSLGADIEQEADLDFAIFAHQVMVTPSNKQVICVARGNDATPTRAEDPGALKLFDFASGQLSNRQTMTPPAGGIGFGPRHLAFHPNGRDVYVSIERQNELQHYQLKADGSLDAGPAHTLSSLQAAPQAGIEQIASAVQIHPNGRYVYQANRSHAIRSSNGWTVALGGEDSLAVYALDSTSGEPKLIQHVLSDYIHTRNVSLAPNGSILLATTIQAVCVETEDRATKVIPPAIQVYRVGDDGRLSLSRTYELNTHGELVFWSGFIAAT